MKRTRKLRRPQPTTMLEITPDGRIRGLWSDEVALGELGVLRIQRASHVEFDEHLQCWCVCAAQAPARILHRSPTRTAALDWEHAHFGPGGLGWRAWAQ